jgi:hypothetical protein
MTKTRTENERELAVEDFAAELTEAAYPVILRQQPKGSWLDLELALWKVLGRTVKSSKAVGPPSEQNQHNRDRIRVA